MGPVASAVPRTRVPGQSGPAIGRTSDQHSRGAHRCPLPDANLGHRFGEVRVEERDTGPTIAREDGRENWTWADRAAERAWNWGRDSLGLGSVAQDPTSLLPGVGGALFGDRGRQIGGAAQGAVRGAMEPAPSLWGRMGNALRGVMGGPEDERR